MVFNRVKGLPTPELLIWARESIGLRQDSVAKKINVSQEKIHLWEQGKANPTLKQLRRLANIYKRPLALFYLPKRPTDFQPLKDFRRSDLGIHPQDHSPELMLAIRQARDRRDWAMELYEALEQKAPSFRGLVNASDDIEDAATKLRHAIGIRFNAQSQWRQEYEALRNWRLTIESSGVLTFHAIDVDTSEARGFSLSQRPLPVVVANIKDAPRGRIFTFLHEIVHVMLNDGGVCDFAEDRKQRSPSVQTEAFCNRVAGAALFPKAEFLATDILQQHRKQNSVWTDFELQELSRRFGGSREAALVRLLSLNLTSWDYYMDKRDEFYKKYQEAKKKQEGFVAPHILAISSAGPTFTRLVIEGLNREKITSSDFSDYLQLRIKHLGDVKREISQQVGER